MTRQFILFPAALIIAAASAACGDDTSTDSSESAQPQAAAGAAAPAPSRVRTWSGIQSCTGTDEDLHSIDKMTAEATLGAFKKSATGVTLTGLTVGTSRENSCTQLSLEGVVTRAADASNVNFEAASDSAERQTACTSPTGKALVVGWLDGYDSDLSSLGGPWSLHFSARIEQALDKSMLNDAGLPPFSKLGITCRYDLTLK